MKKTKTLKESLKSIALSEIINDVYPWMFISDAAKKFKKSRQSILNLIRKNMDDTELCEGRVLRMQKSGNDGPIVVRIDPRIFKKK
jgi:hypothetical protein